MGQSKSTQEGKKVTWIACYELGFLFGFRLGFFFFPLLIHFNVSALINLIFTLILL